MKYKSLFRNGLAGRLAPGRVKNIGSLNIGRVNSCRSGGRAINSFELMAFEYSNYLLLTDLEGNIHWVKVYNYQASQRHKVMSRDWLNQFKGVLPNKDIEFDGDIDAISGATASDKSQTKVIQDVLSCAF